jgi:hypothetical protein
VNLRNFWECGGFQVLALARLGSCSYSLVLYVLNCHVAAVEEIVSSMGELSVLLGVPERQIKSAIEELSESGIIQVTKKHEKTLVLKINLNLDQWKNLRTIPERSKRMLGDAKNVCILVPSQKENPQEPKNSDGIQKIVQLFTENKKIEIDFNKETKYAKVLLEHHPFEQIVSLIKIFSHEFSSLSVLAGAWLHYMGKYRLAFSDVNDLNEFRKKHEIFDAKIRNLAYFELKKIQKENKQISADEKLLLHILMRHDQPRKQLYWALKAKDRYPALNLFLEHAKNSAKLQ